MKTRITAAVASLFVATLGTAAFAQAVPPPPPPQQPPQRQMAPPAAQQGMQEQRAQQMAAPVSNTKVAREIKGELTKSGITATKVTVTFSAGTATLTGTGFSRKDITKARSVALHVQGVTSVNVSGLHARKA